jgi:hypothetical protein
VSLPSIARPTPATHTAAMRASTLVPASARPRRAREQAPRVVIEQSYHREGSTFALSPETKQSLVERFGDKLHLAPRISIAGHRDDPKRLHGPLRKQLLMLLTGVDDEALLAEMGAIEFHQFD